MSKHSTKDIEMTDLITRDPNDTGEIPGETTRLIRPAMYGYPTPIRRQCDEAPTAYLPATFGVVGGEPTLTGEIIALDTGGYPPMSPPKPPPPPPSPNWAAPAGHYPTYRTVPYALPAGYRRQGRIYRGRHARSPRWAWALVWAATPVTVVCLAAFAVWQVTR